LWDTSLIYSLHHQTPREKTMMLSFYVHEIRKFNICMLSVNRYSWLMGSCIGTTRDLMELFNFSKLLFPGLCDMSSYKLPTLD